MSCDSHITSVCWLILAICLWLDMQLPQCFPAGSPNAACALWTLLQAERNVGQDLWFGPEHLKVVTTLVPLTEQGRIVFLQAAPLWRAVWHTAFCSAARFQGEPVNSI